MKDATLRLKEDVNFRIKLKSVIKINEKNRRYQIKDAAV
jgi:hypothetical protein